MVARRAPQAEIAAQGFAEAESAFASRLEAEGLMTVCVPRDGDCAFRCAHLWQLLQEVAGGEKDTEDLVHEFAAWQLESRLASRRSSARVSRVDDGSRADSPQGGRDGGISPIGAAAPPAPSRPPPTLAMHHQLRCRAVAELSSRLEVTISAHPRASHSSPRELPTTIFTRSPHSSPTAPPTRAPP